jgi:hypothetical protein
LLLNKVLNNENEKNIENIGFQLFVGSSSVRGSGTGCAVPRFRRRNRERKALNQLFHALADWLSHPERLLHEGDDVCGNGRTADRAEKCANSIRKPLWLC